MKNYLWIGIYVLINALFVYKYSATFTPHPLVASLVYSALIVIFFTIYFNRSGEESTGNLSKSTQALMIGLLAIILYIVMRQLDPSTIEVGRYTALDQWIGNFLHGEFPYRAESKPSGLPFLFLLAIPFYLVGELGLIQIAAFILFSVVFLTIPHTKRSKYVPRILLLAVSPVFVYELLVRSDLFGNMILIILYTITLEWAMKKRVASSAIFLLGIAGGFVLTTRVVVLLVYLPVLGLFIRTTGRRSLWLITGNFLGCMIMTLPFLYWDSAYFLTEGPFAIQISYTNSWTLLPVVLITLIMTFQVYSLKNVFSTAAFILFLAVFLPFLYSLSVEGWNGVIFGDRFDISYFAFCLPFLLLSFDPAGD